MVTAVGNSRRSQQKKQRKDFMPVTRFVLHLLSSLKLLPITWNSTNGEFRQFQKHSIQNYVFNASFCFLSVEYFFGVFRLIQSIGVNWPIMRDGGALPKIVSLFAAMGTKSIIFTCNLNTLLRKQEVESFINRLLRLRRASECSTWHYFHTMGKFETKSMIAEVFR